MALTIKHKETVFGIGDKIKVILRVKEGDKERLQTFEGIVIKIKGEEGNKTFTVRRVGSAQIGIERIFPIDAPVIKEVVVARQGYKGSRKAKLYFIRVKSKREIEKIYSRNALKDKVDLKKSKKSSPKKKKTSKKKA